MIFYVLFSIAITLAYAIIIVLSIKGWKAIPTWEVRPYQPSTTLSILIPARNEEKNIRETLKAIAAQEYPKELVEVILIDDHSTDQTIPIAQSCSHLFSKLTILPLKEYIKEEETGSFKKKAIETAYGFSTGKLIVQTDADCIMGKNWLRTIVSFYETQDVRMGTAPVNFFKEKNLLERFQSLDFMGMMGITGVGIHYQFMRMCNGANMFYERDVFKEVDGFKGNEDIASGDDMFLLHKVAERYPDKIGFVKSVDATVFTEAKPTLKSFYHQRLRWATKNASYDDIRVLFVNAIVFFTCFAFVTALIFLPFDFYHLGISALIILLGKGLLDYFFLGMMSRFFHRSDLMRIFLPAQIMHILYIFSIGMAANFIKKYEWKGRKVR